MNFKWDNVGRVIASTAKLAVATAGFIASYVTGTVAYAVGYTRMQHIFLVNA